MVKIDARTIVRLTEKDIGRVKIRYRVEKTSNNHDAPLPQVRRRTDMFTSRRSNKKVRIDEEEGFDDHNLPQDFPDIVESADTAYHIAAPHHNKLEPDPPLDPWEKVRQELLDKFLTLTVQREADVEKRKEALRHEVQERVNDACSTCSSCGTGEGATCLSDAPGNKDIKVNQPCLSL
jgi:hypothetical protein